MLEDTIKIERNNFLKCFEDFADTALTADCLPESTAVIKGLFRENEQFVLSRFISPTKSTTNFQRYIDLKLRKYSNQ